MENVYVIGVGMTPFGRLAELSVKDLTRMSVQAALDDAGCDASDLQAAFFANAVQGHMEGQHMIRGQIALREMGIQSIPVVNVENACASASSAFYLAVNSLRAGASDVALAVGAEKMYSDDRERMFGAFDSGWDVYDAASDPRAARAARRGGRGAARHDLAQALQRVHGRLRGVRALPHAPPRDHAAADRGGGREEPRALR